MMHHDHKAWAIQTGTTYIVQQSGDFVISDEISKEVVKSLNTIVNKALTEYLTEMGNYLGRAVNLKYVFSIKDMSFDQKRRPNENQGNNDV